jgi:hypothetical protein
MCLSWNYIFLILRTPYDVFAYPRLNTTALMYVINIPNTEVSFKNHPVEYTLLDGHE